MKVFIDTNIPMYAAGKDHPYKTKCVEILRSIAHGNLQAVTDTEVLQEILYRYFCINHRSLGLQIFDSFSRIMDQSILSVHSEDMMLARQLADKHRDLSARDLVHAAVMKNNSIMRIITADRGFNSVVGIQTIFPV